MKKIGVWIDKKEAYVITQDERGKQETEWVSSNVDTFRIHGGSGSRLKGGPQDVVHDSKYLERNKHQLKNYFKEVSSYLSKAEEIVLFGPAETGEKLQKELHDNYPDIAHHLKGLHKVDSMTENQMKAWVKSFFSKSRKEFI